MKAAGTQGKKIFALFRLLFPQVIALALFFPLFPQERAVYGSAGNSGGRDFELTAGNLKLVLYKEVGTFALYKKAEIGKDKYEPILDTRNYGAGTKFSVIDGKNVYVLEKKIFRQIGFETADGGKAGVFVFTPNDDFQVRQKFYFSDAPFQGSAGTFLVIETAVENTSGKAKQFAVKAMFDTVLGENGSFRRPEHFTADDGRKITAETVLSPRTDSCRFLFSSNGRRSCAFPLEGTGLDVPDNVYVANWYRCEEALASDKITPDSLEGRSFSTVYAPNDSAVLFAWRARELAHRQSFAIQTLLSDSDVAPVIVPPAAENESGSAEGDGILHHEEEYYGGLSFEEKRDLYLRISDRLHQIESGHSHVSHAEIAELNRILGILLEEE